MEGHCRLGLKCAYNHKLQFKSHNEDTESLLQNFKKMKAEIDVLKNTVNVLVSTKEESEKLRKDIECIKEDIKLLRDTNKDTADRIGLIENDFQYKPEDEVETYNVDLQSCNDFKFNNNRENESFVANDMFEDVEDLFQTESVDKETRRGRPR